MALLIHFTCREPFGFASHFRGDPLLTNDVLYQLSYSGADAVYRCALCEGQEKLNVLILSVGG